MQLQIARARFQNFVCRDFYDVFSCTVLTSINMISLATWWNKHLQIFLQTTNRTCPTDSWNFVAFEKFTCAYLQRIALEIMLLPKVYKHCHKHHHLNYTELLWSLSMSLPLLFLLLLLLLPSSSFSSLILLSNWVRSPYCMLRITWAENNEAP